MKKRISYVMNLIVILCVAATMIVSLVGCSSGEKDTKKTDEEKWIIGQWLMIGSYDDVKKIEFMKNGTVKTYYGSALDKFDEKPKENKYVITKDRIALKGKDVETIFKYKRNGDNKLVLYADGNKVVYTRLTHEEIGERLEDIPLYFCVKSEDDNKKDGIEEGTPFTENNKKYILIKGTLYQVLLDANNILSMEYRAHGKENSIGVILNKEGKELKWYSKVATPCTFKYNKNVRRSSHVKETLHERFQDRSRKRIYEREHIPSY